MTDTVGNDAPQAPSQEGGINAVSGSKAGSQQLRRGAPESEFQAALTARMPAPTAQAGRRHSPNPLAKSG